jgi:quinolinate synthase
VEEGCNYIIVLGVDFMSENVRAVLDAAGHTDVPVYRLAEEHIGCSLAEAAESDSYFRYATRISPETHPPSAHARALSPPLSQTHTQTHTHTHKHALTHTHALTHSYSLWSCALPLCSLPFNPQDLGISTCL